MTAQNTARNIETVKKLFDACTKKDFEAVRALVHEDYALKDPMMQLHGPDELIEMLKTCPGGGPENITFISEGDKVVTLFDAVGEGMPKMRMCDVLTLKDGKVIAEEMIYDTAQIPQEMKDQMMKGAPGNAAPPPAH